MVVPPSAERKSTVGLVRWAKYDLAFLFALYFKTSCFLEATGLLPHV